MRVLVLAAHPDDEVLGAGATIAKFAMQGSPTRIVAFTTGVGARGVDGQGRRSTLAASAKILGAQEAECYDFPDNMMDTVPLIDVARVIEENIARWSPDLILTHTPKCLNIDHKRVFEATLVATRTSRAKILSYEVLSSTEWNLGSPFNPSCFVDVTGYEQIKIEAMRRAYGEELRPGFHPRSLEAMIAQMRINGSVCCVAYAERFETVREVM